MNTALNTTCSDYVIKAIQETKATGEPLLEEPKILSDQLQDRLQDISLEAELEVIYQIITTAFAWDDSYAPLTTEPKDMLRQLAYACLIAEAKSYAPRDLAKL